jgi:hypothetical protein
VQGYRRCIRLHPGQPLAAVPWLAGCSFQCTGPAHIASLTRLCLSSPLLPPHLAGKSTLAAQLAERYGLLHISAQALLDAAAAAPGEQCGPEPLKEGQRLPTMRMAELARLLIQVSRPERPW